MKNNTVTKKEIKNVNDKIIKLKYELEERYNDYYAIEIGYEFSKLNYGKRDIAYKVLDKKENILCDINYLIEEIRVLEDKRNCLRYLDSGKAVADLKCVFE